jgi:hypothetical protein
MSGDSNSTNPSPNSETADFIAQAAQPQPGLLREFWDFLRTNKKWWLSPLILVLLAVAILLAIGATGAAPFIYTLF